MITRYRVFKEGEKKNLAKTLMFIHFREFCELKNPLEDKYFFLKDQNYIKLDYKNDKFEYIGNILEKDILSFKDAYEKEMACKLKISKIWGKLRKIDFKI